MHWAKYRFNFPCPGTFAPRERPRSCAPIWADSPEPAPWIGSPGRPGPASARSNDDSAPKPEWRSAGGDNGFGSCRRFGCWLKDSRSPRSPWKWDTKAPAHSYRCSRRRWARRHSVTGHRSTDESRLADYTNERHRISQFPILDRTRRPDRCPRNEPLAAPQFLVGSSEAMERTVEVIRLVACRRSTVLITGETGT